MCKELEAVLVVKAQDVVSRVARLGILTSHALPAMGTPAQNPNDKVVTSIPTCIEISCKFLSLPKAGFLACLASLRSFSKCIFKYIQSSSCFV